VITSKPSSDTPHILDKPFPQRPLHILLFQWNNKQVRQQKEKDWEEKTINDPRKTARPISQISMPKYVGLRLKRNGPGVSGTGPPLRN
jgi:hypothetical protein